MRHIILYLFFGASIAPLAAVFDKRLTLNSELRMQANFECVFAILMGMFSIGSLGPLDPPIDWFERKERVVAVLAISVVWLALSLLAMLGKRAASKMLFILAWVRLLLPCVGWFFSFFAIRYYLAGMRRVRDSALQGEVVSR